ncbi:exonuclease [Blastocystis sp. ATCC 50177/Nand II]|uniref:Golgi apparatus membrane protein TVP23 homolog n=1 Tax=Blastocystis sp. subtype 1 (strain ATCC 50177 / NandII) TaxID=478820 RepID=A0A196SID3_BLAHN|nr:exonuclease [Blastocystis sp. ATCC 50177/Nand II]
MSSKENNPFLPDVEFADEQASVSNIGNSFSSAYHPISCFFHVSFKVVAVFFYLFGGLFVSDSIVQTVIVVLMNAFDFYVVKNFSGRYLAGLRWWSVASPDGLSSSFRFEKTNHPERVGKADSRIFWTFSVVSAAAWCFFCITSLLGMRFYWLAVALISASMSCYNLYAYILAAKDAKTVLSMFNLIPKAVTQKAVERIGSAAMSMAQSSLSSAKV